MFGSDRSENVDALVLSTESCVQAVKQWTLQNKLQLNEDKTEALLIDPSHRCPSPPSSLCFGQSSVPFSECARNLGVMFDQTMSMKAQVDKICQSTYIELRRIASIRQFLTNEATKTLVTSLILSRLDYCNSLLAGIPQKHIDRLQRVMNCAARLITRSSKREHVTPLLVELHWLPIARRIEYKIATVCFNVISNTAPTYLSELFHLYVPSRALRSASDTRVFRIPNTRKKSQGQRSLSYMGPVTWNSLPFSVRHADTLSSFKSQLKTHLFSISY